MSTERKVKKGIQADIVKESKKIKRALMKRFNELELTGRAISEDALMYGMSIDQGALSRYQKKPLPVKGGLSHKQIIWLCMRYCVPVRFDVQGYRKLANYKELGLPAGTLVPVKVEYSDELAERNLERIGYTLNSDN